MTRVLVVCDFDGTITTLDTLNVVADHCIGHARRRELDEDILHERCTFRDGLSEMFSGVRMAWQDAVALLHSRAPGGLVEPSFPDFAHRMLSDSDVALCVVSSGFEQLIRHILHDAGLPALEVHANGLDIDPESSQWRINFRDASSAGHDKVATVQALRQRWPGAKVLYVGDGISDVGVAKSGVVDALYAKEGTSLHRWCREHGVAHTAFSTFASIAAAVVRESE